MENAVSLTISQADDGVVKGSYCLELCFEEKKKKPPCPKKEKLLVLLELLAKHPVCDPVKIPPEKDEEVLLLKQNALLLVPAGRQDT